MLPFFTLCKRIEYSQQTLSVDANTVIKAILESVRNLWISYQTLRDQDFEVTT